MWRQYASAFWDDIRIDNVVPFQGGTDPDDEAHVHPLQLDVIERAVILWSNPGENVLTPFMGVGSEVVGAIRHGRRGIGAELKPSYFRQAIKNALAESEGRLRTPAQSQIRQSAEDDDLMDEEEIDDPIDAPRGRIRDQIDPPPDRGIKPKHETEAPPDTRTIDMFGK